MTRQSNLAEDRLHDQEIDGGDIIVVAGQPETSVLNQAQVAVLTQESPKGMIQTRQGRGGQKFDYLSHNYVTEILNSAFGHRWDFCVEMIAVPVVTDEVVVKGRLTVYGMNGQTITKEQFGQQDLIKSMAYGDALKSAGSDALRKCASLLGIGLDLYGTRNKEEQPERHFDKLKDKLLEAKHYLHLQNIWKKHFFLSKDVKTKEFVSCSEAEQLMLTALKDSQKAKFQVKQPPPEPAKTDPKPETITDSQIEAIEDIITPTGSSSYLTPSGGSSSCLTAFERDKLQAVMRDPKTLRSYADEIIRDVKQVIAERIADASREMEED